jgi:hypothetical protein
MGAVFIKAKYCTKTKPIYPLIYNNVFLKKHQVFFKNILTSDNLTYLTQIMYYPSQIAGKTNKSKYCRLPLVEIKN